MSGRFSLRLLLELDFSWFAWFAWYFYWLFYGLIRFPFPSWCGQALMG
jgi:hypothetical protein